MTQIKKDARTFGGRFSVWWWLGVPIVVILVSYGPFLLMNCVLHTSVPTCWRVSMVGQIVFDFSVYSATLVSTALSIDTTALLPGVFQWLFRMAHLLVPAATPAELWLFFRIIFGVLIWWMLSWTLEAWTNVSRVHRRVAATALWLAIFLPLGFRQGVYSWFMPFGLVLFAASGKVPRLLERQNVVKALLWTGIGLAVSTVYAWFLVFAGFWFVSTWCEWLITRLSKRWIVGAWLAACLTSVATVMTLVLRYGDVVQARLESMYRVGFGFTFMPMISTMLFAAIGWLVVIFVLSWQSHGGSDAKEKEFGLLFRVWLILVFAWCSSLFMGAYIHNDHFRTLILLFAWISAVSSVDWTCGITLRKGKVVVAVMGAIATIISFMYVIRPYAFDGDQLNTIHLFVWAALACISARLLWSTYAVRLHPYKLGAFFLTFALVIGGLQYAVMFTAEAKRWPSQQQYAQLFTWMRSEIPESDHVCVEPTDAEFIGSQSGRSVFFTEQNVYPISRETLRDRLVTFSAIREVDHDVASRWTELLGYNYIPCGQFGLQRRVLAPFMSSERLDRMLGCDRAGMRADEEFVQTLPSNFALADIDTSSLCPWIVVNRSFKGSWSIPDTYRYVFQDERFIVYRLIK